METIELSRPLLVNGKELTELPCDMDAITVERFIGAEARANAKANQAGSTLNTPEFDSGFHLYLAFEGVMAADPSIDVSDLERVTGADIMKFVRAGRFFVVAEAYGDSTGSGSGEPSESSPESATARSTK